MGTAKPPPGHRILKSLKSYDTVWLFDDFIPGQPPVMVSILTVLIIWYRELISFALGSNASECQCPFILQLITASKPERSTKYVCPLWGAY